MRVFEDVVGDLLRLSPETATSHGEHAYDDQLDDLSPEGRTAAARVLADRRDELDSLDEDALTVEEQVDLDVLRGGLDLRLFEIEVLRTPTWDPLVWLPGEALHPLLTRDTLPAGDRLRALAARLRAVPDRLALAERVLEDLPGVHRDTALAQAAGAVALVRDEVTRLLQQEPSLRGEVEPAQAGAIAALQRYAGWLRDQPATRDPRLGAEVFAAKLHLVLDAGTSSQQVVHAARENLERVTEELERATGGDVRGALARLAQDAPDDATVVDLARRNLLETADVVRRTGLATVPDDPCEVQVMPEFRRGVAVAYCDPPGALESGGTTHFAISPTPSDWSAERVASFYREYNAAMITNLTVHEAMPGHVLQLAHARRHPSLVRKVLPSGSFIEGWAVHAEQLMVEHGHGGLPVRLQQLKMQLRMTINALLDAGVHAGGLEEAEGIELMTRRGFQEEGEAVGKWRRALLTSAQLSTYFVGYAELAPLLAGRSSFDDVLAHGSPAPRHLRRLLAPS